MITGVSLFTDCGTLLFADYTWRRFFIFCYICRTAVGLFPLWSPPPGGTPSEARQSLKIFKISPKPTPLHICIYWLDYWQSWHYSCVFKNQALAFISCFILAFPNFTSILLCNEKDFNFIRISSWVLKFYYGSKLLLRFSLWRKLYHTYSICNS